jgi:hypothetical protein
MQMDGCKLSPKGLGMSLGVLWGLALLIMGLLAYVYSFGRPFVDAMAIIYLGYEPSILNSILGGVIGFAEAYIVGFLIAYLYNAFCCCSCSCCGSKEVKEEPKPASRAKRKQQAAE